MPILRWAVVAHLKCSTLPLVAAQSSMELFTNTIKTPPLLPMVSLTTGMESRNHHSIRINLAAKSVVQFILYRRRSSFLTTKDCVYRKQLQQRARSFRRQQDKVSLPTLTTTVIRASLMFSGARD